MNKRKNYEDHFEDLYLRHGYLKKCENLDGNLIKEYAPIVNTTAKIMFDKLRPNFQKVGFDIDDIIAITNVYMLSYMTLYSIRFNENKKKKFFKEYKKENGKNPTNIELIKKDRNALINFLRQRLQHCQTVCSRKARSIVVGSDKRGYYAFTDESKSASNESILKNYKKLGYRKVTAEEHKASRKRAKKFGDQKITDGDGFEIIEIQILSSKISRDDYKNLLYSYNKKGFYNPEELIMEAELERDLTEYKEKFINMETSVRRNILKRFIETNKGNKYMKKELSFAHKVLRNPKIMV